MLKLLYLNLLALLCGASVIHAPLKLPNELEPLSPKDLEQIQEKWIPHLMDFFNLVDTSRLMSVVMQYVSDPDVVNFANFMASKEFQGVALEFEAIEEFKEAMDYLQNKGHDVKSILEFVNSLLELQSTKTQEFVPPPKNGKGMTRFIGDILRALPINGWKQLFELKLETSPDVKELFETLSTEEFEDILKRFAVNQQLLEIKKVFEVYGLDFDELNLLVDEIFGDYFSKNIIRQDVRNVDLPIMADVMANE